MAAGYDGSININTRIDERGFNSGIKSLIRTLKNFAGVVGIAFGIGAIVKFGSTAVSEASDLASALTGLQSVVSGQGKSFSDAQGFIDDYISDGLIPATNAITAYKNLALRGYDTSQIQETMTILKDTAAFGRQSSLSMGEAVQSATEGLKNENSILVDNAGVTKNVAKMWQDYADAHGLSVSSLTQEQKIEAEMIGLRQESIYQTGDAAKMADTYAGKVAGLNNAFYKLKVGIGNIFMPILQKIIPVITTIVNWLTALANRAAQVIQILLGVKITVGGYQDAADSANAAAEAQDNLAGATEDAGKAAKGALAPFDELNVLQQDTGSGEVGSSVDVGDLGGVSFEEDGSAIDEQLDGLTERIEGFKTNLVEMFAPSEEPFQRLKEQILELGGKIWDGLKWAWNNILVPIGTWAIEDALPVFLDLLAGALDVVNAAIDALKPLGKWLWEEFLQPAGEWAGEALLDALEWLTEKLTDLSDWIGENEEQFRTMTSVIAGFILAWIITEFTSNLISLTIELIANTGAWIANTAAKIADKIETIAIIGLYAGQFISNLISSAVNLAIETAAWIASTAAKVAANIAQLALNIATGAWNVIAGIASVVTTAFGAAVAFLTSPIGLVILAIVAIIAIVVLLIKHWDEVKEVGIKVWEWMKQAWVDIVDWVKTAVSNIGQFFSDLWTNITDGVKAMSQKVGQFFTNLWEGIKGSWESVSTWFQTTIIDPIQNAFETALDWIGEKWETVFTGIQDFVKGVINQIIDFINGMISAIVKGINAIISGINSISIKIPDLKIFGEWAGQSIGFNIPSVAAPRIPKLATGAVIPPNSAFAAILGDQRSGYNLEGPEDRFRQIVQEELAGLEGSRDVNINFGGSMGALIRAMKPYIEKEDNRVGRSMVTGGVS